MWRLLMPMCASMWCAASHPSSQVHATRTGTGPTAPASVRLPLPLGPLLSGRTLPCPASAELCCLLRALPCPADLKPLYSSSSKAALLGQLFERLQASLQASGALPPVQGASGGSSSEQQPAPQALVW